MKKVFLSLAIIFTTALFANEIEVKENKLTIEDDCVSVYKAARDAALEQGFSGAAAQQIGAAAYYTCRGKTKKIVSTN